MLSVSLIFLFCLFSAGNGDEPGFPEDDAAEVYRSVVITSSRDVIIPHDTGTTYWCSLRRLSPSLISRPHHVVAYEGVFRPASNRKLVHHIEVFSCGDDVTEEWEGRCDDMTSSTLRSCGHVIAAWASGAGRVEYPKEAGSLLDTRFVRLEVHYNNPALLKGVRDHSGIRLWLAPHLRPHDIAIVETGNIYSPLMAVPPKQKSFVWNGYCPSSCTKVGLPLGGVKVVLGQLHSHLAGRKMQIMVVRRNGSEEVLLEDDHYSTWRERITPIPSFRIFPGDSIVTSCDYDTEDRKEATVGGEGIRDEMCVAYLHYYPASPLEVCKSVVSRRSNRLLATIFNRPDVSPASVRAIFSDPSAARFLQSFYDRSPVDVACKDGRGRSLPGRWTDLEI